MRLSHWVHLVDLRRFGPLLALIICGVLATNSFAQAGLPGKVDDNDSRVAEMKQRLAEVQAEVVSPAGKTVDLVIGKQPLLRFQDPARAFHDGGIWSANAEGVPVMLIALEHYESGWAWELISLTNRKLTVELPDGWKWSPQQVGAERKPIPNAASPAASERARLVQMKLLARKFSASESGSGQTYELRLLPQPLTRYADPKNELIDGALFVFVYGTNPEILMSLECHKTAEEADAWYCGFAPLTTAKASVRFNDNETWAQEPVEMPKTQSPYTYFQESNP